MRSRPPPSSPPLLAGRKRCRTWFPSDVTGERSVGAELVFDDDAQRAAAAAAGEGHRDDGGTHLVGRVGVVGPPEGVLRPSRAGARRGGRSRRGGGVAAPAHVTDDRVRLGHPVGRRRGIGGAGPGRRSCRGPAAGRGPGTHSSSISTCTWPPASSCSCPSTTFCGDLRGPEGSERSSSSSRRGRRARCRSARCSRGSGRRRRRRAPSRPRAGTTAGAACRRSRCRSCRAGRPWPQATVAAVRVVAGEARGRRLVAPEGRDTRPTLDRVREAMFNALV